MNVKYKGNPLEHIRDIIKKQNGIIFTSDLAKHKIPRIYLSILVKNREIQRISKGIYATNDHLVDEAARIQATYKTAIFSHETALYFWELTDRSPLFYSVTVPAGYNATSLKANGIKVYFVKRSLYLLGLTTKKTPHGNAIKTFNLERTICDVIRSRNRIDVQFFNDALKRYALRNEKKLDLLYDYAGQFRIQRIARRYLEVLL